MMILPQRTLPAVGHQLSPKELFSGLGFGREDVQLDIFREAKNIAYTSSGSAALVVSLLACKMASNRKKVIIPAYTCPSVLAAVEAVGLRAVLCDLAPRQLFLSQRKLAAIIDRETLAIVYVHLFGMDRQIDVEIKSLALKAGAYLVEDAAQAFGNKVGDKYLGTEGDLSIISFGRGKPLSTLHGGAVVVNNSELDHRVQEAFNLLSTSRPIWFGIYHRLLLSAYVFLFHPRLFGLPKALPWYKIGETVYNDHINVHSMAPTARRTLRGLIKRRTQIQRLRSRIADTYLRGLQRHAALFSYVPSGKELKTGPLRFPIVFKNSQHKRKCLACLTELGLGASGSYPVPINVQKGVPANVAAQGPFPNAVHTADCILTLPTHEFVTGQDAAKMLKIITEIGEEN